MGLKISVVFSDLLAQCAQGLGIVLIHLLLSFLVLPQLMDRRGRKGRTGLQVSPPLLSLAIYIPYVLLINYVLILKGPLHIATKIIKPQIRDNAKKLPLLALFPLFLVFWEAL